MRLFTLVFCSALTLAGCKSKEQKELEAQWLTPTPLEHDPTEPYELAPWWSNGKQLLQLNENASYALYHGMNRYAKPLERGRWAQQSYAVLWLEPYNTRKVETHRVGVTRIQGRLSVLVPKLEPMFAIEKPPAVLEDRLIGRWESETSDLRLRSDMRYSYSYVPQTIAASNVIASTSREDAGIRGVRFTENGVWSIEDDHLVLRSDQVRSEPTHLELMVGDQSVVITTPDGPLTAVNQAASATAAP